LCTAAGAASKATSQRPPTRSRARSSRRRLVSRQPRCSRRAEGCGPVSSRSWSADRKVPDQRKGRSSHSVKDLPRPHDGPVGLERIDFRPQRVRRNAANTRLRNASGVLRARCERRVGALPQNALGASPASSSPTADAGRALSGGPSGRGAGPVDHDRLGDPCRKVACETIHDEVPISHRCSACDTILASFLCVGPRTLAEELAGLGGGDHRRRGGDAQQPLVEIQRRRVQEPLER